MLMWSHAPQFVFGLSALAICLSGRMEQLRAEDARQLAIESYFARLIPIEQESFCLLEREWQDARHLDELRRSERYRTAMLGFLDRGFEDELANSLIPRDLKAIYESRYTLATRELQDAYSLWIRDAELSGRSEESQRLQQERGTLTSPSSPFGLSDAKPDKYRTRSVICSADGSGQNVNHVWENMTYRRSLSRVSLSGVSLAPDESSRRQALLFLIPGEPRRGYLAVDISTGTEPGKYFLGIYEHERQVAAISLPLEAGTLYRWGFEYEREDGSAAFELYDEQSRQQRLFLRWKNHYEIGFGTSVVSPQNSARLTLMLLPPSPR